MENQMPPPPRHTFQDGKCKITQYTRCEFERDKTEIIVALASLFKTTCENSFFKKSDQRDMFSQWLFELKNSTYEETTAKMVAAGEQ